MARMPRNQLLDALFALFREREQWPIKLLREKTQQPEVYLKEVLSEIASQWGVQWHLGAYAEL
jgi:transcription initiation factor TFIIF subunit beta